MRLNLVKIMEKLCVKLPGMRKYLIFAITGLKR